MSPADPLPITTALELPGMQITHSLGVCFGLVVRSLGIGRSWMAGLRSIAGGEITEYTELLEDSRRHAVDRMVENARLMGADGIVSMRFDSSEISQAYTEIVAYGTAVLLERAR